MCPLSIRVDKSHLHKKRFKTLQYLFGKTSYQDEVIISYTVEIGIGVFFPHVYYHDTEPSPSGKNWSYQRKMKFKVAFSNNRRNNSIPFFSNSFLPSTKVENFIACVCKTLIALPIFFEIS